MAKDKYIGFQYPNIKEWDKIVDDSNFRTTSEIKRDMIASGNVGVGEKGLYDYDSEQKITKENVVSDIELALRNGKLDKADVQKLRELSDKSAQEEINQTKESKLLSDAEKASKNRTAAIDKMLEVNQDS